MESKLFNSKCNIIFSYFISKEVWNIIKSYIILEKTHSLMSDVKKEF